MKTHCEHCFANICKLLSERLGHTCGVSQATCRICDAGANIDTVVGMMTGTVKRTESKSGGCSGCGSSKDVAPEAGITRPSCLECVQKHLGAAMVLIDETHDGYAYRLRAIGHLHEAADESQAWPELHIAIREARKAYQADGTVPDWEALGGEVLNA